MTDTIGIYQHRDNIADNDYNNLINCADTTTYNNITQTYRHTGTLGNFKIFVFDQGVSFIGSLSSLYHGSNFYSLNRQTLPLAVSLLEDSLNIPLRNGKITRLDLAQSIILDHHPNAYLKYFGMCNYHQRLEHQNGIEHRNSERNSLFYNKKEECRKKKKPVPREFETLNIGRFETRLQGANSVNRQMGTNNLALGDLCIPAIYNQMYQVWGKSFDAIEKITDGIEFKTELFLQPKQLCNQLMFEGIKSYGGPIGLRNRLATAKRSGVFKTPKQYSSAKRKVRLLNSIPDLTMTSPLIAELEQKVHDIIQYSL